MKLKHFFHVIHIIKTALLRGLPIIKSIWIYILQHPGLGVHFVSQGCVQHCSVFTDFLFFFAFGLFLSAAKELKVRAPARANKNTFFISLL